MMKIHIKTLMGNVIPVFVAAGNRRQGRPNADTAPAAFEGQDYPLVVVAPATYMGCELIFRKGAVMFALRPGRLYYGSE